MQEKKRRPPISALLECGAPFWMDTDLDAVEHVEIRETLTHTEIQGRRVKFAFFVLGTEIQRAHECDDVYG